MGDKIYISYETAKDFLLDVLKNNDFSEDEDVRQLLDTVAGSRKNKMSSVVLSRILIDKSGRIFLPEYSKEEIKMPYLPKTVFIFFLFYPEGHYFKRLCDFQTELCHIYEIVAFDKNTDALRIRKCIENLVKPINNRIYETCSIIRKTLLQVVPAEVVEQYCIVGKRGSRHQVNVHRSLVTIENEELKKQAHFLI